MVRMTPLEMMGKIANYILFMVILIVVFFCLLALLNNVYISANTLVSPPVYPTAEQASQALNATCRIPPNSRVYCCDFGKGEEVLYYNPSSKTYVRSEVFGGISNNPCLQ